MATAEVMMRKQQSVAAQDTKVINRLISFHSKVLATSVRHCALEIARSHSRHKTRTALCRL